MKEKCFEMDENTNFTVNKNIIENFENNGIVILNLDNGNFYGLYDVSYAIWELLKKGEGLGEIKKNILKGYLEDEVKENIIEDIYQFINELINEKVIIII